MMQADAYFKWLRGYAHRHRAVRHPFLDEFVSGRLSMFQLRLWAPQHAALVRAFPSYLERLIPRAEHPELLSMVLDAERREPTLATLMERFTTGLGLGPESSFLFDPTPQTARFIREHRAMAESAHPTVALGALGAGHVWAVQRIYPQILTGLRKRQRHDLEAFSRPLEENALHAHLWVKLVEAEAATPSGQAMLRQGAEASLEARARFWDGVADVAHVRMIA